MQKLKFVNSGFFLLITGLLIQTIQLHASPVPAVICENSAKTVTVALSDFANGQATMIVTRNGAMTESQATILKNDETGLEVFSTTTGYACELEKTADSFGGSCGIIAGGPENQDIVECKDTRSLHDMKLGHL